MRRATAWWLRIVGGVGVLALVLPSVALGSVTAGDWPDGSVTAAAPPLTFSPQADARVEKGFPTANFGASSRLKSDASPVYESLVRFTVTGTTAPVQSARLRLYVTNGTGNGPAVYTTSNEWTEASVTWSTKPARTSGVLDDVASAPRGAWVELDVTAAVTGDGTYSFTVASTSTDGFESYAREGAYPPQLVVSTDEPPPPPQPPTATAETRPVPRAGDAADDAAVWIHPSAPASSTIIGTDKMGGLAVYDLAGTQLFYYAHGNMNNVDLRYNFMLGESRVTLVAASDRTHDSMALYRVEPDTRGLVGVAARTISMSPEPYGLCMYRSALTGKYYTFTNDKSGVVRQWELSDNGAGRVDAKQVRSFDVGGQTEGCVADDETGAFYVGEEDVGIWRYGAEPGDGSLRAAVDSTGSRGHLAADVEGLTLYYTSAGGGYLLASSQGANSFVVYDRAGGNAYRGTFSVPAGSLDGVSETDGIDVTNVALGDAFPEGVFVAQDDQNDSGNQNYKLVPWERVARAVTPGLAIDTSWNPRAAGA